jgi:hypothetical protein
MTAAGGFADVSPLICELDRFEWDCNYPAVGGIRLLSYHRHRSTCDFVIVSWCPRQVIGEFAEAGELTNHCGARMSIAIL